MKWFKSKALRKQRLVIRKSPKAKEGPKPKYQQEKHIPRGPRIEKPVVERPFIGSLNAVATIDMSEQALRTMENDAADRGGVTGIKWNLSANPCPKCQDVNSVDSPWSDIGDFLDGRQMSTSPTSGLPLGICGYSHPECSCSITVFYEDGSTETVSA